VLAPAIGYCMAAIRWSSAPRHHRHGEGQFPRQLADLGRRLSAGNKVPGPLAVPQPAVGNTYSRILKEAEAGGGGREPRSSARARSWSQGFVAEAIDRFYTHQELMDVSGQRNKGLLRGDDMAKWQATIEAPLTYDYGRYTVCKAGPWAQSPVTLQQLALLKGFDLDGADPTSADFIHTVVEASKLAFADREAFYGDPKFVDVPMQTLLSDTYNAIAAS
jgi:gamma-glutamyltranspeptidase/glutathione hydrolase